MLVLDDNEKLAFSISEIYRITGIDIDDIKRVFCFALDIADFVDVENDLNEKKYILRETELARFLSGLAEHDSKGILADASVSDEIVSIIKDACNVNYMYKSLYCIKFQITGLYRSEDDLEDFESYLDNPLGESSLHRYLMSKGWIDEGVKLLHHESLFSSDVLEDASLILNKNSPFSFVFPSNENFMASQNIVAPFGTLYIQSKASIEGAIGLDVETDVEFYVCGKSSCDFPCLFEVRLLSARADGFVDYDNGIDRFMSPDEEVSFFQSRALDAPLLSEFIDFYDSIKLCALKNESFDGFGCSESSIFDYFGTDGEDLRLAECIVDHDSRVITAYSPTYIEIVEHCDYYEAQSVVSLPSTIISEYQKVEDLKGYSFKLSSTSNYSISIGTELSIAIMSNPLFVGSACVDSDCVDSFSLKESYSKINTVSDFVSALIGYGVTDVSANEVLCHDDGDMAGNVFVAFVPDKPNIVFSVVSLYGYCETYSLLRDTLNHKLAGGFRVVNVLEYNWGVEYVDMYPESVFSCFAVSSVLQMPQKPESFSLPFLAFPLALKESEFDLDSPLKQIDQGRLLDLIIPDNSPIPKKDMYVFPLVFVPYDNYISHFKDLIKKAKIRNVQDQEGIMRLHESLRLSKVDLCLSRKPAIPCLLIICDANDSDLIELSLRNMLGLNHALRLDSDTKDKVGKILGVGDGCVETIFYWDSADRAELLGI